MVKRSVFRCAALAAVATSAVAIIAIADAERGDIACQGAGVT